MPTETIDQVISKLDNIILDSKEKQSPLGYFAALYRKVTLQVKIGIEEGDFQDGPGMAKLDVIFANRYLIAYDQFLGNHTTTLSWEQAFAREKAYWPIVLQHLLLGMNAHINLDLGIAAAETAKGKQIAVLHDDFMKINAILANMVDEVQQDLVQIWPFLSFLLKVLRNVDNWLIDFSMKIARDGAWTFAQELSNSQEEQWPELIRARDKKVCRIVRCFMTSNIVIVCLARIIRLGERGTVAQRIQHLVD